PYLAETSALLEAPEFDELRTLHLALRTAVDPALTFASVRSTVSTIDPEIAVDHLQTMDTMVSDSVAPERFNLALVVLFAILAIFLAAVGVYGVLSYSISQRTREFGVRIALGAQPGRVLSMAISEGMKLALLGILIGLVCGFVMTRLMSSLLFGVTARDPITFVAVGVLVVLVSLTACYIPARRAMRVDPIVALRYE
ncbi:MAG: FtsX-like permease family protein, partial [Candidatus Acidiferrum sp.]